ncbi:D-glycero-beta-D-manno-heptose 1,7-bisphosphate 7-phosphatase [Salinisphaera sp. P385]|uniref:D,D-heptose 1,7-bisphosphate phosphatase n=1 Tax=Spectribacter acetivorans TaxID=3075603 RepID=A0ABU3B8U3_9GAMM|nr:D-glycero-beta-D-manno-heptose 1,7-bisphosphate 7-phosphatase [Salinisphaera sp. P385]MDT0618879.1 D-glycero-beta-D-manno-heptose 1,7-bisphosphate 7-phosphatase [Salinisphaera sp. P385]
MKLVVLDRDGVINEDSPDHIRSPKAWRPLPGSLEAIARLSQSGYRVVVASNQSGIGRGLFNYDELFGIHEKLQRLVGELGGRIDGIFFCPHVDADQCECRKPAPGLFREIGRRLQVDLSGVPAIGDSRRDLAAARAAGAQPILVRTGNGASTERDYQAEIGDIDIYDDLASAANALI